MKLKIKIKRLNKDITLPEVINKGEWIDLRASQTVQYKAARYNVINNIEFTSVLINLGIAVKLPKGFEAVILPRSSTFNNFGIILSNSQGVIDNSYSGNYDEWKFNAIAFKNGIICEGDRICQFRIQLSQKATIWQKLKWLLSSGIKIIEVESLDKENREGFGSTGIK